MSRKLIFSTPATFDTERNLVFGKDGDRFERSLIEWQTFPDGTPKILIPDIDAINNRDVVFIASFEAQADYFAQFSAMYEIALAGPSTFTIVLPYFPTAAMERPEPYGTVVTAKSLAAMLSTIPPARSGITELVIFDPHTEVLKSFFDPHRVRVTFRSFMPTVADMLKSHHDGDWTVVCPDKGAKERFGRFFRHKIACDKARQGNRRIVTIDTEHEADISGRNCIVVDDLMQTGGTLIECAKALRAMGAKRVDCAFTHAVCPDESWRRLGSAFEHVFTTSSCPTVANELMRHPDNFSVTKMSSLIADVL